MSEQAREYLIGFLESVFNAIQGVVNWIVGVVQSIANWIWSGIQSMFIDPIQKAINTLVERFVQRLDRVIFFALGIPATMREAKRFIDRPSLGGIVRMAFAPVGAYIASQILAGFFRMSMGAVPSISYPTLPSLPAVPTIPKYEYVVETYSERADIREEVSIKAKSPYMLESVEDTNANDVFSTALVSPQSIYESESASTTEEFTTTLISPVEESYSETADAEDISNIYASTIMNLSTIETADTEDTSTFSIVTIGQNVYGKIGTNDYRNKGIFPLSIKGNITTPSVLWEYSGLSSRTRVACCGVVNEEKTVFVLSDEGELKKLRALDGSLIQEKLYDDSYDRTITLWDINMDGKLEVIFYETNTKLIRCLDAEDLNTELWSLQILKGVMPYNIGDVDGDGSPEMVVPAGDEYTYVVNGNGEIESEFVGCTQHYGIGLDDIDNDGKLEIISGRCGDAEVRCYEIDGTLIWSASPFGADFPVIEDLDGDGINEFVCGNYSDNHAYCRKVTDGSLVWCSTVDTSEDTGGGMSCVGDLDGDGIMEIVYGDDTATYMFKGNDGSRIWKITNMAGPYLWQTGCIACDIDGDGKYEVVGGAGTDSYPRLFYCVNAEDGSIIWTLEEGAYEYCQGVLWDVDGDGVAEFIFGSASYSSPKVRCLEG